MICESNIWRRLVDRMAEVTVETKDVWDPGAGGSQGGWELGTGGNQAW